MKKHIIIRQLPILLFLSVPITFLGQQPDAKGYETIELCRKYKFYSNVLEEEREILVRFPRGYESSNEHYPVVYQLDAQNGFIFTAGLLRQITSKSVPRSILVGVLNTDRQRDFIPPFGSNEENADYPAAGNADDFMMMLEEDLFPFVNENFRTKEYKTLLGGSLGGLFVIYVLSEKPDLFNAYLSVGPSLWWNTDKVVEYFEERLKAEPDMKALFFMTMGNEGVAMGENMELGASAMEGLMDLVGILERESPENLRWGYKVNSDETHYSNAPKSLLQGFDFFYEDWFVSDPVREYLQNGLSSFESRSRRIEHEFGEVWDLSTFQYSSIIRTLNSLGMFSESADLGISLLNKGISYFDLLQEIVDAYIGLGDMENAKKYYQEAYKSGPGDPVINRVIDSLGIDKQSLIPRIKLSAEDLERFTGEYVNSWNGNIISITLDRDTVLYSSPGGKYQLIPIAQDKVYFCNTATTIEFILAEEKGNPAPHFILHLPDGEDLIFGRKN